MNKIPTEFLKKCTKKQIIAYLEWYEENKKCNCNCHIWIDWHQPEILPKSSEPKVPISPPIHPGITWM